MSRTTSDSSCSSHGQPQYELNEPKRPRTSKACLSCRARKVRCDALQVGIPCTKCNSNDFECSITSRKKRRKKGDLPKPSVDNNRMLPRSIPEHIMLHQVPHYPFFQGLQSSGHPWLQARDKENGVLLPVPGYDGSTSSNPVKSTMAADDIEFLRSRGALLLPSREILDKCVSIYFQIFHPFFPVLDKPVFLDQYRSSDQETLLQGRGISLLLLQAIIFTASLHIPNETIHDMGFSSNKQARATLYKRALYLHKLDFEPNDITTIQALLLLSHHYPSMVEQRHTWFWVHQAIGLAQGTGLHRDPGDVPQRKLWARVWWACLVRDRLISLGTGRPMHINSLDCSVRPLTAVDLEEDGDSKEDRVVKTIFIQFVKLCQYMEGVLSLPLVPVESLEEQVRLCDSTLQQWLSNLPIEAQLNGKANEGTNTTLYRTLTHLTYNVVIISLRNFESKQEGNRPESQRLGFETVQSVAVDSVNLLKTLISEDLVQTCPTQCVTTVLPPLIINLMGVRYAQSSQDYRISMAHYQTCMKFLKQLGEVYWHASFYHDLFKLAASHISATPHPQDAGVSENLRERLSSATVFSDNNPQGQFETTGCDLALEDDAFNRPRSPVDYFVSARSPVPIFESNGNSVIPVFEPAFNLESIEAFDPGHVDDGGLNLRRVDIQALTEWLNQDGIFQSFFPSA